MAPTKYRTWTTKALLEEVKRLKELMKTDTTYIKATRQTQLKDIARELERRR
jgi:hypothetical protein